MLRGNIRRWLSGMSMELLYSIIEFMACFVDVCGIYVFLGSLCTRKMKIPFCSQIFIGIVLGAILSYAVYSNDAVVVQIVALFFIPFIYSVIFFRESLAKKIYFNIMWNVVLMVSNLFVGQVLSKLLGINGEIMLEQGTFSRVIILIVHKIVLLFMVLIFICYSRKYKFDYKQWVITVVQFVSVLSVGAIFVSLYKDNAFRNDVEREIIAIAVILSVMCIVVCICQHVLNVQSIYKVENEKLKTYLEEEEKNIKRIKELYEHSNIIRHDIKHYAVMMKTFLLEKNYSELESMVDMMSGGEIIEPSIFYTDDALLNAVLNDKIAICKKNNVEIQVMISCRIPQCIITNVCVVLSNLLDNAIEAEKKEENGYIKVHICNNGNMLNISVNNKISNSVLEKNPELATMKKNKKEHGFGIKSINKRVRDMDGTCIRKEDNNEFKTIIRIPV